MHNSKDYKKSNNFNINSKVSESHEFSIKLQHNLQSKTFQNINPLPRKMLSWKSSLYGLQNVQNISKVSLVPQPDCRGHHDSR